MCGIVGWANWYGNLTTQGPMMEKMTETLRPRGPDASGFYFSTHVAMGHRRLIVVDPTGGAQPMTRTRGNESYTLTYNGELYNTDEIRQELSQRGYQFHGHSDTEVLLVSYMEWGMACVKHLNGIFAFAVWDEYRQDLFLARDRMGVKPLFYTQRGSDFLYASELKALLAHPSVPAEIDGDGLATIFGLGPARTPGNGVFRGIKEIRPGWCLQVSENGIREWPYWQLVSQLHTDSLPTTIEKVRWLVGDSIQRQLVSDVPICTFLSGGLDSSAITAYAAAAQPDTHLDTFSIDYVDNTRYFHPTEFQPNSDAPWVERVAAYLKTNHHELFIDTPQLTAALVDAVEARGLPGMADVDSSLYLFCKAVKTSATVALSGECADEIFGGYPWFHREDALWAKTFPWSQAIAERDTLLAPELRAKLHLNDYVNQAYQDSLVQVPQLAGESPVEARRRAMAWLNLWWFMQTLLERKDRMSMATGLEVRVPFCDHRIVEYLWNVPWEMKAYKGREKGLLRASLSGVLPDDVLWRKKSPYPKTYNPSYTEAMQQWLLRILHHRESPLVPLLDMSVATTLVESGGNAFQKPWYGQLMTGPQLLAYLIQVETWLQQYHVRIVGI